MIKIILASFLFWIAVASVFASGNSAGSLTDGVLDLRGRNADYVPLDGNWEFYWKRFITNGFEKEKPFHVPVPGRWNYFSFTNFSSDGYATYRIRIIPDSTNQIYSIHILNCEQSYRLYVNGKLTATNGVPAVRAEDFRPERVSRVVPVGPAKSYELVLQVSSFRDQVGGIFQKIYFGKSESVGRGREKEIGLDIFVLAAILIMSLYHVFLFFYRRMETGFLYFAVFGLLLSLRVATLNNHILSWLFPGIDFYVLNKLEVWPTVAIPALIVLYLNYLYPGLTKKMLIRLFVVFGAVFSFIILALPSFVYTLPVLGYLYALYLFLGITYSMTILIRAIRGRIPGSRTLLTGFLVFYVTVINDILYFYGVSKLQELSSYGLIIFIVFQTVHLAKIYSRTRNESQELKTSNIILEEMVAERTRDLEEEKNILRHRNEQMEKELFLARQIQMKYIPRKNPSRNIAAFYKPMELIGGDFYDFIEIPGSDMIGIFISDVSGHGVPAAFVTSMIKSTIMQTASVPDRPEEVLYELNDVLLNMSGGNFVTAIYGLLDRKNRSFTFANAGHNCPYYIGGGTVSQLSCGHTGIPLAVMENGEIRNLKNAYAGRTFQMEKGGKLIIYTDGLTEAVSKDDPDVDFETAALKEAISRFRDLPAEAFVGELYLHLVDFHGSDRFLDDICMICVDVD